MSRYLVSDPYYYIGSRYTKDRDWHPKAVISNYFDI